LILDGVQDACGLTDEQMELSRSVLRRFGNMSSASIMFILQDLMAGACGGGPPSAGRAMAFGPGLTVETLDFTVMSASPPVTGSVVSVVGGMEGEEQP
jgi:predicted naringenin-chalcone synthase